MTITPDGILEAYYSSIAMTAKLGTTTILMRTDEISLLIATGSGTAAVDGIQYETEKGSILCLAPDSYYLTNGSFWRISSENLEIPPGLYTDKNGDLVSIAERLHAEDIRTDRSEKMIDAILQEISAEMERSCIRTGDINDNDAFDYLRYIDRNSGTVTLQRFADQYGFTEQYASALINKKLDVSFTDLLRLIRMSKSIPLLEGTSRTCADIATEVGYSSQEHFSRVFSKFFGTTPFKYRSDAKLKRIRSNRK